jgi:uncharacterized protein (TIRG00374 family)
MLRLRDKFITILKLVVSLGLMSYFFYLFLSDPNDRQVLVASFIHARYGYWVLALVFYVLAVISNAYKWQILLKAQGVRVPLTALTNYTFVGFFFTNFLPSNVGGDLIRGFGLARYTDRAADAAVSVVVDRIIGLMAFMASAVVAALIAVRIISTGQAAGLSDNQVLVQNLTQVEIGAFVGLFIILAVFAVMLSHRLRNLVGQLFRIKFLKPLGPIYEQLSTAFGAYRQQYRALLAAFIVGLANPLLTGLVDLMILAGLGEQINPLYVFLFNPIIAFALIVPISIGGLGACRRCTSISINWLAFRKPPPLLYL